ncbi:hypothetical protein [Ornithinimicrobium kibberense]|uniref:hypothetical protein n=1 Tax=Ornithinimicrobium kibberense TaxID=282060 RepID=UPI0036160BC3
MGRTGVRAVISGEPPAEQPRHPGREPTRPGRVGPSQPSRSGASRPRQDRGGAQARWYRGADRAHPRTGVVLGLGPTRRPAPPRSHDPWPTRSPAPPGPR